MERRDRSGTLGKVAREVVILAFLGLLAGGGAYLVRKNLQLEERNEDLTRLAFGPRAGLFVAEVPAPSLAGESVVLGEMGKPQLLFFFNTTCLHCRASLPNWNRVAAALESESTVAVYGVAFDELEAAQAYVNQQGIRFPVVAKPDPRLAGLYRIHGVPAIILINDRGRMAYARVGPLDTPLATDSVLAAARTKAIIPAGGG